MDSVTIQLVAGSGLGAGLIKWYGHGRYSHADIVLPPALCASLGVSVGSLLGARDDVIMGVPAGVQIRPASYVIDESVLRVTIPMTEVQAKVFYDFALAQIGKPYDEEAIAAFFTGSDWSQAGSWFCSMLVAAALQACGWLRKLSEPCNKIDPDDLLLVLSALVPV